MLALSIQPFTLPGTRSVGDPDPPADMNTVVTALIAMGAPGNVMNANFAGGADPTGTNDSTAAFGSAVSYYQSTGQPVIVPPGTYKVSSLLNWKVPGLRVITAGAANTVINQVTANTPILAVAGEGQYIGGLTLRYPSQQSSGQTGAIGVQFGDDSVGSCFLSTFEDLRVYQSQTGFAIGTAITSAAGLFSCYFGNTEIFGYSESAINLNGGNGAGASCTGCVFDNTYVHNNFSGTAVTSGAWPVIFRNWSEIVFNELNIEKCLIPSPALQFAEVGNAVINSLHLEGVQAGGTDLALIGVGTQVGAVVINGLSVRFCTFTGSASNAVVQFTAGSGQSVQISGFNMPTADGGNSTPELALVDFNSIPGATVTVSGINPLGPLYTTDEINATTGDQVVIQDGAQVTYAPPIPWTTFGTGGSEDLLNQTSGDDVHPAAGTWYYADVLIPYTVTMTGLIAGVPSGGGTDKWVAALWPYTGGSAIANSGTAGTTTASGNPGSFKMPFTSPVVVPGPAAYKAAFQSNGTTATFQAFANTIEGFVTGSQAGTFGSVPTLSAGTAYTQNAGPMLKTY